MSTACKSYMPERPTYAPCRDGFPQTAVCAGIGEATPSCCKEEMCGRFYEQWGGKPPEHMLACAPPAQEQE